MPGRSSRRARLIKSRVANAELHRSLGAPLLLGVASAKLLPDWPARRVALLTTASALVLGLISAVISNGGDMTMDEEWHLVIVGITMQALMALVGVIPIWARQRASAP